MMAAWYVKSASVHYYFPTKADIGVAVAENYTERS
jgi:AcrR family transcriptional regulator